MAIRRYLAMTAAEIEGNPSLPQPMGWMACRFSPYSGGLSNLPDDLPEQSLLILNDFTPIDGHDPSVVGAQLRRCIESLRCAALLLDFQRPGAAQTAALAAFLVSALPCPVAAPPDYANDLNCPVFLPPLPHHIPLRKYLAPWKSREIWLDIAPDAECVTLTEQGARFAPISLDSIPESGHQDAGLHCHYRAEVREDRALFTLWRTPEDLEALLEEAETLGITTAVGLYQELAGHP